MSKFNPEMLVLARESRGMTQTELAKAISVQQGTVSKVEAGILPLTEALTEKFAVALDYPNEFFFQPDRIYGFNSAVFFHRKRQALSDRILRRLHASMNLARMRIARLLAASEICPTAQFQRIEIEDYKHNAGDVAQIVRSTWMIPIGPLRNVTEAIENAGGIVVRMDFGTRQADAISEWIPGYPPIFLVNSDVPGDRLRLTLAHEIAHVVLHRFPNPEMELQANAFAAEFMMPRKQIKASLYNLTMAKLIQLKRIWKVSMAALIQRAFELKTITDSQRRYLFINMGKRGYRMVEPNEAEVPVERPALLGAITRSHVDKLGYSQAELMRLLFLQKEDELCSVYLADNNLRLVG